MKRPSKKELFDAASLSYHMFDCCINNLGVDGCEYWSRMSVKKEVFL